MAVTHLEHRLRVTETVEEALAAVGENIPSRVHDLAQLRLRHPGATNVELGRMMEPPMAHKTVKKRLRVLRRLGGVAGAEPESRPQIWKQLAERYPELRSYLDQDTTDERARLIAEVVAAYVEHHGKGPTWRQVAIQVRPDLGAKQIADTKVRFYAHHLVTRLIELGWLTHKADVPRSLRPGPRSRI
ncbi:hypothetical protein GCM10027589_16580 [Actinocorallia lasiicapitis]